jgi:hypothetical protein
VAGRVDRLCNRSIEMPDLAIADDSPERSATA